MLEATTLQFLQQLKKNNSKEWFDQHRKVYEIAKADFANLIDAIIKNKPRVLIRKKIKPLCILPA